MGKPTLFVILEHGYHLKSSSNKLDEKFDVHYWPHSRRPSHEEMRANVKGVFGIICGPPNIIDSEIIDAAGENLRVVATASVGYDNLDVKTLKAKGIRIGHLNSPAEMTVTVAEHAIGLLFATARRIANDHLALRKNVDFWNERLVNNQRYTIWNSAIGIIGCGKIGTAIMKRLLAFSPKKCFYSSREQKSEADAMGAEWRSVDDVCENSDYIIVTAHLSEETHHLINRARIDSMKPSAMLINVARGGIVEEEALVEALQNKKIAGAGLDVLEKEPIEPNNTLLSLDNVVVTPHAAFSSSVVRDRMLDLTMENILAVYENREMPSELL
ncbi:hypothetical protein V9T40_001937 [Parthenolecanium corni]|uniref:Glycerate dehydrogenase n=1 Tax=Parthenolecanium corni TaxID=536013 RepID=A0AAN9TJI2_9HEMI